VSPLVQDPHLRGVTAPGARERAGRGWIRGELLLEQLHELLAREDVLLEPGRVGAGLRPLLEADPARRELGVRRECRPDLPVGVGLLTVRVAGDVAEA